MCIRQLWSCKNVLSKSVKQIVFETKQKSFFLSVSLVVISDLYVCGFVARLLFVVQSIFSDAFNIQHIRRYVLLLRTGGICSVRFRRFFHILNSWLIQRSSLQLTRPLNSRSTLWTYRSDMRHTGIFVLYITIDFSIIWYFWSLSVNKQKLCHC